MSMDIQLPLDSRAIAKLLPHRYPFLLVDRVVDFEANTSLRAYKNVTMNEEFFQGHFPGFPVMPGVLVIEAMAQAAGLLSILSLGGRADNEIYFFAGIDKARFKRQVVPGDQLVFEIQQISARRGIAKYTAVAKVDGLVAAEAEIMCAKKEIEA